MSKVRSIALTALASTFVLACGGQTVAQERVAVEPEERGDAYYGTTMTVPEGTDIPVTIDQDITIEQEKLGQSFKAHVTRDVMVGDRVAIPSGTHARVQLVKSETDENQATLRLTELGVNGGMESVRTEDARADTEKDKSEAAKKTGVGAAAGAVVGAVTGVGVLEGAVIGAGGGLAWGLLGGRDVEVGKGTQLSFELSEDVEVR